MKELEIISTIQKILSSKYIGDDCAFLEDLGIVITQDSLVEDVHFSRKFSTPYQIGYKSVAVNLSDIYASGAEAKYLTLSLSLPKNINDNFVKEFYEGAKQALNGAKIVGGDVTGSDNNIMVSVCAIGIDKNRNISSRKNAKTGYAVVTHGLYGSSALGLNALINKDMKSEFIKSHLEPTLCPKFSEYIACNIAEPYAMMDTSDGLADALFKIAEASDVKLVISYDKIPHVKQANKEQVLFGGEDYNLLAVIPSNYTNLIPNAVEIGYADKFDGILLDISGEKYNKYDQLKVYSHFGE